MTRKLTHVYQSRKYLLIFLFILFCNYGKAQVTIGAGTAPQPFSILEIVSNGEGGARLPHLTAAQRNALSLTTGFIDESHRGDTSTDPGLALGLIIYNTDTNCIEYWDGYKWVSLCLGTANIILRSPCGDYNIQSPPIADASGNPSACEYTPEEDPYCKISSGSAYNVYLTGGSAYTSLTVDEITSAFSLTFTSNNSSQTRYAVVRVVSNCTGEFKDFIFPQAGATCPSAPDPILNATTLDLCSGGSVFARVTNVQNNVDYVWTLGGVIVHTGNWYEITRAGTYEVHTGLLNCGTATTLVVTKNGNSSSPSAINISATNNGELCAGGNVVLTAATTATVLWYHDGIPLAGASKNNNPLTLSGASEAGNWFAVVVDQVGCVSNSSNVVTLFDNTSSSTALPIPIGLVNGQSLTGSNLTICKSGTLRLEVTNTNSYPSGTEFEWFSNGVSIGKSSGSIMYLVAPNETNMILSVTAKDQSGSCPNTAVSKGTFIFYYFYSHYLMGQILIMANSP